MGFSELTNPPRGRQGGALGKSVGDRGPYVPKMGVRTTPCRPQRPDERGEGSGQPALPTKRAAPEELSMVSPRELRPVPVLSIWVGSGRKTNARFGATLLAAFSSGVFQSSQEHYRKECSTLHTVDNRKSRTGASRLS